MFSTLVCLFKRFPFKENEMCVWEKKRTVSLVFVDSRFNGLPLFFFLLLS